LVLRAVPELPVDFALFGLLGSFDQFSDTGRPSDVGMARRRRVAGADNSSNGDKTMSYVRRGMGDYENSGDWTWEHWPPPFTQWGPSNPASQPSSVLGGGGLGCTSCGGGCGDPMGLGQATGLFGTSLFAGGLSPSTWGVGEWATVAVGGYIAVKVVSSHPSIQRATKKSRRAASAGTAGLGTIVLYGAAAYAAWWAYSQYVATPATGLSDYQSQGFATPQILQAPVSSRSSALSIPIGF
jgi:hypothetical protein